MALTVVSAADIERVKAASKGFYTALAVIDNGEAMAKVWAHTPYITIVGPRAGVSCEHRIHRDHGRDGRLRHPSFKGLVSMPWAAEDAV